MKEQHKIWQNQWRQIMGKPLNVDKEPDCDYDLHFDIWDLNKEDFFKLFEDFTKGKQLAERAYKLRHENLTDLNKKNYNELQLIEEAKKSIADIHKLYPSDELINPKISVIYGDSKLRLDLLNKMDTVSIDLDDNLSDLVKKANGEEAYAAYFFLGEPFYRLASSYIPRNWILWTLTDIKDIDPYTPLLRLYYNNCDVALGDDRIVIFKLNNDNKST